MENRLVMTTLSGVGEGGRGVAQVFLMVMELLFLLSVSMSVFWV